jgi:hypothetical protein
MSHIFTNITLPGANRCSGTGGLLDTHNPNVLNSGTIAGIISTSTRLPARGYSFTDFLFVVARCLEVRQLLNH